MIGIDKPGVDGNLDGNGIIALAGANGLQLKGSGETACPLDRL